MGVVHIHSTCEGQGSFLHSGFSQRPLSSDGLLTPALVEYRDALARPSSFMGARDPNSGPQACTLFQLSHSPDLEYFFQKRSHSFKYPIQY